MKYLKHLGAMAIVALFFALAITIGMGGIGTMAYLAIDGHPWLAFPVLFVTAFLILVLASIWEWVESKF